MLAKEGLFPPFFGPGPRRGLPRGLIVTAAVVLVVANTVDLSAIASVGSATALTIFLLVGGAGFRRRHDTGSNVVVVLLAIAVTAVVLVFFAIDTIDNSPETFVAIIAITVLAVLLDAFWTRARDRGGAAARSRRPAA